MCFLSSTNWFFISQMTAFFIVTAAKTSNLTNTAMTIMWFESLWSLCNRDWKYVDMVKVPKEVHVILKIWKQCHSPTTNDKSWKRFAWIALSKHSPRRTDTFATTLCTKGRSRGRNSIAAPEYWERTRCLVHWDISVTHFALLRSSWEFSEVWAVAWQPSN
jgi:hypothetical protein